MPVTYPIPSTTPATEAPAGLIDAAGEPIGHELDHSGVGLGKLIYYFQTKPRIAALLGAFLAQVQGVEDLAWAVYSLGWDPDGLVGVQLDTLGAVIGEPRGNKTDGQYRPNLKARQIANRSDSTAGRLTQIALVMAPDAVITVTLAPPACIVVSVTADFSTVQTSDLLRMLQLARPAGVRLSLITVDTAAGLIVQTVAAAGVDALGVADVAGTTGGDIAGGG